MKLISALIWLLLANASFAQAVVVKSGDHAGFTRLVLELPKVENWKLGRTDDGYELRIDSDGIRFDVTSVFKEIQRNRLAAIWSDPERQTLRIGIACACHAIPFEFRPGIIVIDLRDGPPPKGSSFELGLDGTVIGQLETRPVVRPRPRPLPSAPTETGMVTPNYKWLESGLPHPVDGTAPDVLFAAESADLSPLKQALLRQLSKGAAEGVVQMAQPTFAARNAGSALSSGARGNIRLANIPGFVATTEGDSGSPTSLAGEDCIKDEILAVGDWGNDQPVSQQLANSRVDLLGEFDRPDSHAVIIAAKLLVHLGFGAEARQLLAQMPVDDPDTAILNSMATIVDGAADLPGAFQGMQTCNTAAALWATLAMPQLTLGAKPRTEAVLRSFSALPPHLRRSLGPELASKFLVVNDVATARTISNAVGRVAKGDEPKVTIMDAAIDLAAGDPQAATDRLNPVLAEAGPATAEAMIALVDAHLATFSPTEADTATALAALIKEQSGSAIEPALRRAEILALGLSGQFDMAFSQLPKMMSAEGSLWQLLAQLGSDSAVLTHAVIPAGAPMPQVKTPYREQIALHLFSLGLAQQAIDWIGPFTEDMDADNRILAAKAHLAIREPAKSLTWLDGLTTPVAFDLRAKSYWQLGKFSEAADAWSNAGNPEAANRALGWAENWQALSSDDTSNWQSAAALLTAEPNPEVVTAPGPIALGNALLAESTSTRATLTALLAAVPRP